MTEARVVLGLGLGQFETNANKAKAALKGIGDQGQASSRQIAAATRQLPAQFTDIATQLAGGANPFLVLLQQGGQIRDSFGSIGAAAGGIVSALNPVTVAIAALAGTVGVLGYAAVAADRNATELRNTLTLTGNAAGLTGGRLDEISKRISDSSRQTVGASREIGLALAATGQTSQRVFESQALAIARIADLSGKAGKEIAASFAGQLEGPAKFAAKLNELHNFLNVAQFKRIQLLEREGKIHEAANLTNQILIDKLTVVDGWWDKIAKSASKAWASMTAAPTTLSRIEQLRGELNKILAASGGRDPAPETASAMRVRALRDGLAQLGERMREENQAAARLSDEAERNRAGIASALAAGGKQQQEIGAAILDARQQYHQDFLRSEKAFYGELAEQEAKARELARQDPLGEFITERVLPDAEKRQEQRLNSEADFLQGLVDANQRAGIELLANERERGAQLIELDRQIAIRRLRAQGLSDGASTAGEGEINEAARLQQVRLDRQIQATADRAADAMAESIGEGILRGFRKGENAAEIFLRELQAQFAKTILTPLIRPTVDAGNELIKDLIGAAAGVVFGGGLTVDTGGAGLNPGAGDIATGDVIRGRRASGGPVAPFSTYLVGEQGPELLRMGPRGGHVVPGSQAGGVTLAPNVSIHVDARADAAQVAQMVAAGVAEGNRQTIELLHARGVLR